MPDPLSMTESDEHLVSTETARLRAISALAGEAGSADRLRADLLEMLPVAKAAAVLRDEAMRALEGRRVTDVWIPLAHLSFLVQRERRRLGKDDRPIGMRARLWPTGKDVAHEVIRLKRYAARRGAKPPPPPPAPDDSLFHDPSAPYWRRYEQP